LGGSDRHSLRGMISILHSQYTETSKIVFLSILSTKNTVNRWCKSSIPLLFFNLLTANNAVGDFDDLNVILKLTSI
jgi:hypothetical protein